MSLNAGAHQPPGRVDHHASAGAKHRLLRVLPMAESGVVWLISRLRFSDASQQPPVLALLLHVQCFRAPRVTDSLLRGVPMSWAILTFYVTIVWRLPIVLTLLLHRSSTSPRLSALHKPSTLGWQANAFMPLLPRLHPPHSHSYTPPRGSGCAMLHEAFRKYAAELPLKKEKAGWPLCVAS